MTKRKTILAVLLGVIMTLCLAFAVACGGEETEMGTIKWTINDPTSVTVTVNGSTERPEEYAVGETLTFKVEPKQGYSATVQNGRATLNGNSNNEYSFTVKKGTNEIIITVKRQVTGVTVKTPPTKLTYYAGEKLDETGMVVEVSYATGENDEVNSGYTINYPTENADCFMLGDTSFTVSYGTVVSANVQLSQAVVGKVTIDLKGGEVTEGYMATLTSNTALKNVKNENGEVSFTFEKRLNEKIALPTGEEISRGEVGDYTFLGWALLVNGEESAEAKEIPAEQSVSVSYAAKWKAELVTLTSIGYENGEGEHADDVYLVVNGVFRAAESIYLYFYEGNAKIELKGDEVNGTRGKTFALRYDMKALAEARWGENNANDYFGKWMDIKFRAESGDLIDTQEINLNDYPDTGFVDINDTAHSKDYVYTFQVYTPENSTDRYLKAVVNHYIPPITLSLDEAKTNLVLTGTLAEKYYGKTVEINYEPSTASSVQTTTVGDDGTYSVSFPLADMTLKTNLYFHYFIKDTNGTVLFAGNENNLLNTWIQLDDTYVEGEQLGDLDGIRTRLANADETRVLYIGYGKWGGLIGWIVNETAVISEVSLEVRGQGEAAKGYVVYSGTWNHSTMTKEAAKAALLAEFIAPLFKNLPPLSYVGDWLTWNRAESDGTFIVEINDDDTFEMLLELPAEAELKDYLALYMQRNTIDGTNIYAAGYDLSEETIQVGKYVFSLEIGAGLTDKDKTWANGLIIVRVEDPTVPKFVSAKLKVDNYDDPSKVYYVVTVNAKAYSLDEVKKFALGNIDGSTHDVFAQDTAKAKAVEENVYELWFDITAYSGTQLYVKLFMQNGTVEEVTAEDLLGELKDILHTSDGLYAVVGGKKYTIHSKDYTDASGSNHQVWNFPCVEVRDAAEGDTNPKATDPRVFTTTAADLAVDGDKVYFVLSGISEGYDKSALEALLQSVYFDFQDLGYVNGEWPGPWEFHKDFERVVAVADDCTWTLKFDVTNFAVPENGNAYTGHFIAKDPVDEENPGYDLKLSAEQAQDGKSVELNGKRYTLVNKAGSGEAGDNYGCVSLRIENIQA